MRCLDELPEVSKCTPFAVALPFHACDSPLRGMLAVSTRETLGRSISLDIGIFENERRIEKTTRVYD